MVCSDVLNGEILMNLSMAKPPQTTAHSITKEAYETNSQDNLTCIVISLKK